MRGFGFLKKLFGRQKPERARTGYGIRKLKGTDYVKVPLRCPKCSRVVARRTPDRGLARCECEYEFAIIDYRPVPLPEGTKLE
jgi:hypothetical protein